MMVGRPRNTQKELNLKIFKQTALGKRKDMSKIAGTGFMLQFVPEYMREDVWNRPKEDIGLDSWKKPVFLFDDQLTFN